MSDALPAGWATARLDEIAALNPRHQRDLDGKQSVTFIPMPAVSETSPLLDTSQERALESVRTGYTHFAEGDVLFAKITPCMENGKGAVATGLRNGLGCGTTELHVVRPHTAIYPHYLYRFLAQRSVRKAAKENFTGSAGQARVPMSFMEELEIPVPPSNEQRRIVAKLETLLGKVDACQRRLAKIPRLLKRFRQSVLAAACSGRLTADWRGQNSASSAPPRDIDDSRGTAENAEDLPDKWQATTLGALTSLVTSGSRGWAEYYSDTGAIFIRAQDISGDTLDLSGIAHVTLPNKAEGLRTRVKRDDLLITITGANVTKSARVETELNEAYVSQHVALVRLKEPALSRFVFFALISPAHGRKQLTEATYGQGKPGLNLDNIRSVQLALPPLAEQHEIVRRVEQLLTFADQLEARFAKAQAHVDKLTQSLLAKAFRGELVPQDPNDEPAEKLLHRISTQRTKAP